MFVLGIQGSPRIKGNSRWMLTRFLEECEQYGATTQVIDTCKEEIKPCRELVVCEKKGYCPLKDDMEKNFYGMIRRADIIVLASPVFFYNVSAQVKILIDRCQMFWGRKYKLGIKDPEAFTRQGVLLAVAASGGKKLFDGLHLTATYFFDAVSAGYYRGLTYNKVEDAGAIESHPAAAADIQDTARELCTSFLEKKHLMFVSRHDACRGQIAGALARIRSKGSFLVSTAGIEPSSLLIPGLEAVMAQKKIDLMYQVPKGVDGVKPVRAPDLVVTLDADIPDPGIRCGRMENWAVKVPKDPSPEDLASLAADLETRVETLVSSGEFGVRKG